jgi:integrase/recombinase XerD
VFVNLFGGDVGRAMTYSAVHKLIGRIAARTGIGFTAHMLRHSHATGMVRQGVPVEVVARLLTHRSPATTSQTYVHIGPADIREALSRAGVWQKKEGAQ